MSSELSVPPTTTAQEDLTTAGQRKINLIWEWTQSIVTICVVITNMVVATVNSVSGRGMQEHPAILSSALFLILGFYYSRTNHAAIGGIGYKPSGKYLGR